MNIKQENLLEIQRLVNQYVNTAKYGEVISTGACWRICGYKLRYQTISRILREVMNDMCDNNFAEAVNQNEWRIKTGIITNPDKLYTFLDHLVQSTHDPLPDIATQLEQYKYTPHFTAMAFKLCAEAGVSVFKLVQYLKREL